MRSYNFRIMSKSITMIIPVILCGGVGSRLWPLSRKSRPKQFVKLVDEQSLFQKTILRCSGKPLNAKPIIVGSDASRFLIAEDLNEIGKEADILIEPVARNTCAAIACACLHALSRDKNAQVLVMAADHLISDHSAFLQAVAKASNIAAKDYLVTFGIKPTRPETGYGYIKPGKQNAQVLEVEAFVEKPDSVNALRYIEDGYLWNSGNFAFKASVALTELEKLNPELLKNATEAYNSKQMDLGFMRLEKKAFSACKSISIDNGLMELSDRVAVLPISYPWTDLGDWQELASLGNQDEAGNAWFGNVNLLNSKQNVVHSKNSQTVLFGMQNTIVANTGDVVLVADKNNSQSIKQLVEHLSQQGVPQVHEGLQVYKPWGSYEQLGVGNGYKVKRIVVKPGGALSLQKHRSRAEHWVVVSGIAQVTIGETVSELKANESVYVPLGSTHRLTNRGPEPLVMIEVQTGNYLGEDDIIRLEDVYNRDVNS